MSNEQNASEQAENRQFDPSIGAATRFKAGQSGNPGGRPRRKWLTDVWDEMLEEKLSNPDDRAAYKESTWRKMLAGTVVSAMTTDRVVERTEGKLPTTVQGDISLNLSLSELMKEAELRLSQQAAVDSKENPPSESPETRLEPFDDSGQV